MPVARELSGLRMPEIAERDIIASYRTVGTICFRFSILIEFTHPYLCHFQRVDLISDKYQDLP